MLTLAQELGVEDLQNSCEEHVSSTMSVLNACTFLAAAMDIQDRASREYIKHKYSNNFFKIKTVCIFFFSWEKY